MMFQKVQKHKRIQKHHKRLQKTLKHNERLPRRVNNRLTGVAVLKQTWVCLNGYEAQPVGQDLILYDGRVVVDKHLLYRHGRHLGGSGQNRSEDRQGLGNTSILRLWFIYKIRWGFLYIDDKLQVFCVII